MKKALLFFGFIFLLFLPILKSQNIDSLKRSLEKEENDTIKYKAYAKIIQYYNYKEPIKALPYALRAYKLAEKTNIEKFKLTSYNQLGITYYFLSNNNRSIELFLKALKINEKNNDSLNICRVLNNIGLAYYGGKAYQKALDNYNQSVRIKLKIKDINSLWTTYINIGLCYKALGQYDKALYNYFLGIDSWQTLKEEKNENYAILNGEIGILYLAKDSLDKAEERLSESLIYYKQSKNDYRTANVLLNLGIINIKKKNIPIADQYINEALKLAKSAGAMDIMSDLYLALSEIEEARGKTQNALIQYKRYALVKDSISEESDIKMMNQMEEMYAIEKQESENLLLKKEIELNTEKLYSNKIIIYTVIFLLIIAIVASLYLIKNIKKWKIANFKLKEQQEIISKANDELKQLNADKDQFFTIIAHDLKNPFNSILGFLNLITNNLRNYEIEKLEMFINTIHDSARNTYNLLIDLLMWGRSQSGQLPYEPKNLNLNSICNQIIETQELSALHKKIAICQTIPSDLQIVADKNMLETVLRNLISNAIKFTPTFGQITISAIKKESSIFISVEDNGVGISPENLNKLFDISVKTNTQGTEHESGTGFGLLLCKEFIEKHGGEIFVKSELEKGSNFTFTIPL